MLDHIHSMKRENVVTIVSGLPRSGTSMMMQMLDLGGMEVVIDNIRIADEHNPKGYYELEKVKKIGEDSSWLEATKGKAFKMVSMLLYQLPVENIKYKIIFMQRNMDEILASQKKMIERTTKQTLDISDEIMKMKFEKHLGEIKKWLSAQEHMEVIYISYNDILKNTETIARLVSAFLFNYINVDMMVKVVDRTLYRQRI